MKPIAIEAIQMTQDSLPTVAATAPMENSTKGGTPLATQKAPVQSMPRSRPAVLTAVSTVAASTLMSCTPCRVQLGRGAVFNALRAGFNGVGATPSQKI